MPRTVFGALLLSVQLTLSGYAQTLDPPVGPVILTVLVAVPVGSSVLDGTQRETQDQQIARFDLAMLEAIGLTRLSTETPWTRGMVDFEGVLARDLLDYVNASGSFVRASALDAYTVDIPIDDFLADNVIIATRINGEPMRVRNNGPLWVIYPWSDNAALKRPHYFSRSIWQLQSLTVNP